MVGVTRGDGNICYYSKGDLGTGIWTRECLWGSSPECPHMGLCPLLTNHTPTRVLNRTRHKAELLTSYHLRFINNSLHIHLKTDQQTISGFPTMANMAAETLEVGGASEVGGGAGPGQGLEEGESALSGLEEESSGTDDGEENGDIPLPAQRKDNVPVELHSPEDDIFEDAEFLLTGFTEEEVRVRKEVTIGVPY